MAEDAISSAIDRQEWLDHTGEKIQRAVAGGYESAGGAGKALKDVLHGTWLGHPLHSAVTDVPVGAWTAAVVMDAMDEAAPSQGLKRGADAAVAIGLAGAGLSALSGVTDWSATDGRARKIGLVHAMLNIAATGLFAASYVLRKQNKRAEARWCSGIGLSIAMGSAWLGGTLSYSERIGVDHNAGREFPTVFTPAMDSADLPEGQMRPAEVNGARVLLARDNGKVYAISEVCSHLGGPLSEGEYQNRRVTCPWHGSCFSVEDGRVIHGPATHSQPCLETREQNGTIEVRLTEHR